MSIALAAACVVAALLVGRLAPPLLAIVAGVAVWLLQALRIFDDPIDRWGESVATFDGALAISALQLSPVFLALAVGIAHRWWHRRRAHASPALPSRP